MSAEPGNRDTASVVLSGATAPPIDAISEAPEPRSLHPSDQLQLSDLVTLFHDKDTSKVSMWHNALLAEEFSTWGDLASLSAASWTVLQLPLAVKARLQESVVAMTAVKHQAPVSMPSFNAIQQLDVIVLDISGSMKSRSAIDALKTREDVSKVVFHTMVDRMLGLEMNHAVALVAFGHSVDVISEPTLRFEAFHNELGRLDATQNSTKLYDAIREGAGILVDFARQHPGDIMQNAPLRVFALTDGEDNASEYKAWEVAHWLQEHNVVLDVFPLAGHNTKLQCMSSATNGFCVEVTSEEQGLALFEGEATLHVASREKAERKTAILSDADLSALASVAKLVSEVPVAAPTQLVQAKVMKPEEVTSKQPTSAAMKRILSELANLFKDPIPHWSAFPCADDIHRMKAVLSGPPGTLYEGGHWVVSIEFPPDYPFKPPRMKFLTPIYHCNISASGALCLDILKDSWSPALTVWKVMVGITMLLSEPNAMDPLDAFKADLYRTDRARYDREAKLHTEKHASESLDSIMTKYNLN